MSKLRFSQESLFGCKTSFQPCAQLSVIQTRAFRMRILPRQSCSRHLRLYLQQHVSNNRVPSPWAHTKTCPLVGYTIPWQKHLGLARELIAARPDGLRWTRHWSKEDQVCSFLWSWLAYLDVLGTLSGGPTESSPSWVLEYQIDEHPDEFDEIDCIMGFTTRCVYILAKIAELARACDRQRIGPDHRIIPYWKPSPELITKAWKLEEEVKASLTLPPQPCKHLHASGDVARWDAREMQSTNEAFH